MLRRELDIPVASEEFWTDAHVVLGYISNEAWQFPTLNARRLEVDITSIHRRPNFKEFLRHFHVLFRCNLLD